MGVDLGRGDVRMAKKRLDRPQVRAVLEKMRREGMAQRVRRDLGGRDAASTAMSLISGKEAVPRQVPRLAARGKEEAARPALGPRPRRRRSRSSQAARAVAGGGRQRHHPLLAALAPDQQHARIAPRRGQRQGDELGHPHPGGVEQLHQTGVAQAVVLRPARALGRLDQPVDLLELSVFGRRLSTPGPLDLDRRIVGPPALLEGEAVELLDRREPPRPGRRARSPCASQWTRYASISARATPSRSRPRPASQPAKSVRSRP